MQEANGITCLVTIHGVGFQQRPSDGVAGYADQLHLWLAEQLHKDLSDDPGRQPYQQGATVPIYVASQWPPDSSGVPEAGLKRLDSPLVSGGARIAHIALVYTGLEERPSNVIAVLDTLAIGLLSVAHVRALGALASLRLRSAFGSRLARHPTRVEDLSLKVRVDHLEPNARPAGQASAGRPADVIRQLQDDFAAYVARNDIRERIRDFVHNALTRLLSRDDVARIVVNSHSQGTVLAYDVIRRLSAPALKLSVFVTAGSPLRKYAQVLSWGSEVAALNGVGAWRNYYDADDPVADRLSGPFGWGKQIESRTQDVPSLFQFVDPLTGNVLTSSVVDVQVHNTRYAPPGGLQAHNYWDNRQEFVPRLAALLKQSLAQFPDYSGC